ncbi:FAD-dependent oxidoreductase [Paenalkalicoccus suaedae]|uniref:FAD-dependent oxidoreductase n=1 Tax=Paenalkalicoccus suaedae TaxID=2592382 RepID=A0A859FC40_9BACI|nr:FAD-dependent oxidoreductase [Paenalkalicoccus suaedae]QKS69796.1 FAD-dependent oxidoreductase [Paenalkalicoccus suaedae]
MHSYDVIVVGGGVIGGAISYYLSKQGVRVLAVEQRTLGYGASSKAAGMLAVEAEYQPDHPLYDLAMESRRQLKELAQLFLDELGIDIGFEQNGMLLLGSKGSLTLEDMRELEPKLRTKEAGVHYEEGAQIRSKQLTLAYWRAAIANGVEVLEQTDVKRLLMKEGRVCGIETSSQKFYADTVIVASGVASSELLPGLCPLLPVKGEIISVTTEKRLLQRTIYARDCYLVPKGENELLIGATSYPGDGTEGVSLEGVMGLLARATALVPELAKAKWNETWSGVRPRTFDDLPYIGRHPEIQGLVMATGHYRNGMLLSAITGQLVSDLVWNNRVPEALAPVSPERRGVVEHGLAY